MARRIMFWAAALLSLFALWLTQSLRFEWYVDDGSVFLLRGALSVGALGIVACWVFFPSRILAAALGVGVLVAPPMLDQDLAGLDAGFVPAILVVAVLVFIATHLRRGVEAQPSRCLVER